MKFVFLTLLLLAGCANNAPPKYKQYGVERYSQWDLKVDNPYRIEYYPEYDFLIQVTMDENISISNVKDFTDLYAAELTLKKGFNYYSYKVKKADYKKVSWNGGGIKGTNYYPYVLLFIKFQDSSGGDGILNVDASSKVEELKKKHSLLKNKI